MNNEPITFIGIISNVQNRLNNVKSKNIKLYESYFDLKLKELS